MIIVSASNFLIILIITLVCHDSNAFSLISTTSNIINAGIGSLKDTDAIINFCKSGDVPNLQNDISKSIAAGDMEKFNSGLNNEDKYLNITQLIKKYGFVCEEHEVETYDGYLLTVFRILGNGSPVFLMHGLLSSSDDWVTVGPNKALPYLLAKLGYDVWLGNARGNKHSRKHAWLSTDSAKYWDFSWDEIGRYDLPAMIDYILQKTGHPKIYYIGHSQGTTAYFVMCSERPEYNDKIFVMCAFSVVARMSHIQSPIPRLLAPFATPISATLALLGANEFLPDNAFTKTITREICGSTKLATTICSDGLFIFMGIDFAQLNVTNMPVVLSHLPGGCSTKQLIHYAQEVNSGKFRQFDYGPIKNKIKYGCKTPPDYNVGNITAPMAIFYSPAGDWFSSLIDVNTFVSELPDGVLVEFYQVLADVFCHTDYLFAKDVNTLVYDKAIDILSRY